MAGCLRRISGVRPGRGCQDHVAALAALPARGLKGCGERGDVHADRRRGRVGVTGGCVGCADRLASAVGERVCRGRAGDSEEHARGVGESVVLLAAGSAGCTADDGAGAGSGEAGGADAGRGW